MRFSEAAEDMRYGEDTFPNGDLSRANSVQNEIFYLS